MVFLWVIFMARSRTTFNKETRKGVKKRGKAKKTLMLDAIRDVCANEKEFSGEVVRIALAEKNPTLLTYIFDQIQPRDRARYQFDYDKDLPLIDQVKQTVESVALGEIPPEVGKMVVDCITSAMKVEEFTVLKEDFYNFMKSQNVSTTKTNS